MTTRAIHRLRLGLLATTAAALAFTTTALGGSGVGGVFNLGQSNPVDGTTALTGTTAGPQLQVTNNSIDPSVFSIYGVIGSTTPGASSTAVRGHNKGTGTAGYGVYGSHAGEGIGVYGTAATGAGIGVLGRHFGTGSGPGVKGVNGTTTGAGVLGLNIGGGPGLSSVVNAGVPPLSVNSTTKVSKLNADLLDGFDSTGFLRNTIPLSLTGSTASGGVIAATNTAGTGSVNGIQGVTFGNDGSSGVYGESKQGGFASTYGVAGRAGGVHGIGVYAESTAPQGAGLFAKGDPAIEGYATGSEAPLFLFTNGNGRPPMSVDSSVRVPNLNADKVDDLDSTALWKLGGNAGTTPGTDFLGTTDANDLVFKTNGAEGMRIDANGNATFAAGGRFEVGTGKKVSLGGDGRFEIDAPGTVAGRFVVTDAGNVGIGVPSPSNILEVQQGAGDAIADAWATYSSRRWKTHIHQIGGALGLIDRLRGVRYTWKKTGKRDLGLIAEEVDRVFPEIVSHDKRGRAQALDYGRLVSVLIQGAKEQQAEIRALRRQNAVSKLQNAALAKRVARLERLMKGGGR
jgi:Chaperone of endosialidase